MKHKDLTLSRQEANRRVLNYLRECIDKYPDQRFGQILQNFGFIKPQRAVKNPGRISWQNEFNMEGEELIERVKRRIEDMEE